MPAEPSPNSPSSPPQPTGFARVAKQLTSRTTDLLGIAIVVIGGLAVGGKLTEWWSTDPAATPSTAELTESVVGSQANWGTSGVPVSLEFGENPYTLRQQEFSGTQKQAVAVLTANCRQALQSVRVGSGSIIGQSPAATNDQQQHFLAQLTLLKPIEQQTGSWQIYRLDHALPMVIGVHGAASKRSVDKPNDDAKKQTPPSASDERRLLCWGLAFPFQNDRWKLFSFRDARQTTSTTRSLPQIDLPANSRRVLSIRSEDGGAMVVFEGDADVKTWMVSFNNWFETHDWQAEQPWSASDTGWSARYTTTQQNVAADLQLQNDEQGKLNGILNVILRHPPIPNVEPSETKGR